MDSNRDRSVGHDHLDEGVSLYLNVYRMITDILLLIEKFLLQIQNILRELSQIVSNNLLEEWVCFMDPHPMY